MGGDAPGRGVLAAPVILLWICFGIGAQLSGARSNLVGAFGAGNRAAQSAPQASPAASESPPDPELAAIVKAEQESRLLNAEELLNAAIDKAQTKSPSNPRLSLLLNHLAGVEARLGRYQEAVEAEQRALGVDQARGTPDTSRIISAYANLGIFNLELGDQAAADQAFQQQLSLARQDPGPQESNLLLALSSVATIYSREQRSADAQALHEESVRICEAQAEPRAPDCWRILGSFYRASDRAGYAEEMLSQAAANLPDSGRKFYNTQFSALNALATQYIQDQSYDLAEATYRRAIAVSEGKVMDPLGAAFEYGYLGRALELEGRDDEAEAAYQHALGLCEGASDPRRANGVEAFSSMQLARLYRKEGRLGDAEAILARMLADQERVLDPNDGHIAYALLMLADTYVADERYSDAEPLCERAIKIQETDYGPDSPQLVGALLTYRSVLKQLGESDKAQTVTSRLKALHEKLHPSSAQMNAGPSR
jgi:tetratricopeptide (TPR) repeat protein